MKKKGRTEIRTQAAVCVFPLRGVASASSLETPPSIAGHLERALVAPLRRQTSLLSCKIEKTQVQAQLSAAEGRSSRQTGCYLLRLPQRRGKHSRCTVAAGCRIQASKRLERWLGGLAEGEWPNGDGGQRYMRIPAV